MPANGSSLRAVLQQRLTVLQTEQQADLERSQALSLEAALVREVLLRRAGAIAELEALCQPILATRVEGDGIG